MRKYYFKLISCFFRIFINETPLISMLTKIHFRHTSGCFIIERIMYTRLSKQASEISSAAYPQQPGENRTACRPAAGMKDSANVADLRRPPQEAKTEHEVYVRITEQKNVSPPNSSPAGRVIFQKIFREAAPAAFS